jgi:hypothetical protein
MVLKSTKYWGYSKQLDLINFFSSESTSPFFSHSKKKEKEWKTKNLPPPFVFITPTPFT